MTKDTLITIIRDSLVSGKQKDAEDAIEKYYKDRITNDIKAASEIRFNIFDDENKKECKPLK